MKSAKWVLFGLLTMLFQQSWAEFKTMTLPNGLSIPQSAQNVFADVFNDDKDAFVKANYPRLPAPTQLDLAGTGGYKFDTILVPFAVKGNFSQVVFYADLEQARKYLEKKGLYPIIVNQIVDGRTTQKAILSLYFLDYTSSSAGPYTEFIAGIASQNSPSEISPSNSIGEFIEMSIKNPKALVYIQHLSLGGRPEYFMSYQTALWAGRVSIEWPKYYGNFQNNSNLGERAVRISLLQEQAKYFDRRKSSNPKYFDADRAGSLTIDLQATLKTDEVEYLGNYKSGFARTSWVSETSKLDSTSQKHALCYVGDMLYVISNLRYIDSQRAKSISISGTSSTAEILNSMNLEPVAYFDASTMKNWLYPMPVPGNACGRENGLHYDYREFFPQSLLDQQAK